MFVFFFWYFSICLSQGSLTCFQLFFCSPSPFFFTYFLFRPTCVAYFSVNGLHKGFSRAYIKQFLFSRLTSFFFTSFNILPLVCTLLMLLCLFSIVVVGTLGRGSMWTALPPQRKGNGHRVIFGQFSPFTPLPSRMEYVRIWRASVTDDWRRYEINGEMGLCDFWATCPIAQNDRYPDKYVDM